MGEEHGTENLTNEQKEELLYRTFDDAWKELNNPLEKEGGGCIAAIQEVPGVYCDRQKHFWECLLQHSSNGSGVESAYVLKDQSMMQQHPFHLSNVRVSFFHQVVECVG